MRTGKVKAPIVIGRDHLDCGSVASPNRETEAMKDGTDAVADWPILNALINAVNGASWVSFHHGGGVGIGYSLHAGQVIVADGTEGAARRIERMLTLRSRHGRHPPRRRGLRRGHRRRQGTRREDPRRDGVTCRFAALAALLSGCAPTLLAPSIIRYQPFDAETSDNRLSVRSGPRLATNLNSLAGGSLDTDEGATLPPELGVAMEYQRMFLVGPDGVALHLGAQAELLAILPAPGLGLMAGLSWRGQLGAVSIAPAVAIRGSTNFGLGVITIPGSQLGADACVTLALAEGKTARLGVTPFFSLTRVFGPSNDTAAFTGALLFVRFLSFEVQMGVGRVFSAGAAWNVPLLGVRMGGS